MFSTIGNMIPFPRKGQGVANYLISDGLRNASQMHVWLRLNPGRGIKEVTDYLNDYNVRNGINKWNFPFSMTAADIATYHPDLVDPDSLLNCGRNAQVAIEEMFEKPDGMKKEAFYDEALLEITDVLGTTPMAHEDTLCIFTRFLHNVCKTGEYKNNSGFVPTVVL